MSRTHKVVFTPSGLSLVAEEGQSVLDAAREAGVEIASICGGRGLCRRCQVHLQTGHHAKFAMAVNEDSLTPSTTREDESRARGHLPDDRRMACQARIMGDCVIDLPADTNVAAMHISKGGAGFAVRHDPPVRLYLCELPIPDLDDNPDDASALAEALSAFGISAWPDLHALTKLPQGGVSAAPIVVDGKFYLLRADQIRPTQIPQYDAIKPVLRRQLEQVALEKATAQVVMNLMKTAHIQQ